MIFNDICVPHNSCRQTLILKSGDASLMTIGRGSYIVGASMQCSLPVNLHIGQFCSLATDITFMLQIDKDYNRVTTSADQLVVPLPNVLLRDAHIIKGQIILQNDIWVGHNATIMGGGACREWRDYRRGLACRKRCSPLCHRWRESGEGDQIPLYGRTDR